MRAVFPLSLLICSGLLAQTPTAPTLKWRGSLWASAATSDRETGDETLFLRPVDTHRGALTLDGFTLGADLDLGKGWSLKTTLLGGRMGELLNLTSGEQGSLALPEAQLVWTGSQDTLRLGRMYTFLGMEFADGTQNLAASRGLLFTYAIPFAQVGLNWRHTFTPTWSTDVWVFNGEDRVKDNNRGKTLGLGLNYNHGGASDKFLSLGAYRGAEQSRNLPGAEGRARERMFLNGQWVWGAFTLQWEAETARESFLPETFGATPTGVLVEATWEGFGVIGKYQFNPTWAGFFRAESLRDSTGLRLGGDTSVFSLFEEGTVGRKGLDLQATQFSLVVERTWNKTFSRLEVRMDRLNKDIPSTKGAFRDATSLTWSVGTSF